MAENKPIKLNDQQLMLMASNVADLYHQLSNDLFDNIVDRLKERGSYYLDQQPYLWQLEKLNDMGMLNDHNVELMAEYSGIAEEQIRYIIENEGYKVYTDTMDQLGASAYDNRVMEDLISYSNQAINDVNNLINTTLPKSVQAAYKDIVEHTVAKVVTGLATPETALNETIMAWHAKGFYGYTDAAGRHQRADSYVRTIIRTTVNRVNNEMRTRPAEELGIDTFYYSIKSAAREMCAPIQGKIVTTGQSRTEAGHKVYALSDYGYGRPGGCLGINCSHIMTPFIPGINYLPEVDDELKNLTPKQAIANANAQAKQRQLERNIRFTKEQIHVAEKLGDPELTDRYKMKLGRQKTALKAYLDEHKFLYRDRGKEKYQEDPLGAAKEEIRQRRHLEKIKSDYEEVKQLLGRKAPENLEKYQRMVYNKGEDYQRLKDWIHIQKKIDSGEWLDRINPEKQSRHIQATAPENKSYFYDSVEVANIYEQFKQTGRLQRTKSGDRTTNEKVDLPDDLHLGVDVFTGNEVNALTIKYSKTGVHIIPTYYERRKE